MSKVMEKPHSLKFEVRLYTNIERTPVCAVFRQAKLSPHLAGKREIF
jgi:hypothetical protein